MKHRLLLALAIGLFSPGMTNADVVGQSNETGTTNIPENSPGGIDSIITITENEIITGMTFTIEELDHDHIGDLIITVSQAGGNSTTLMHRVGIGGPQPDGDSSNLFGTYSFGDVGTSIWEEAGNRSNDEIVDPGTYAASGAGESTVNLANVFGGASTQGTWTINISDNNDGDTGTFRRTSVQFTSNAVPEPTGALVTALTFGAFFLRRRRK